METKKTVKKTSAFTQLAIRDANANYKNYVSNLNQLVNVYGKKEGLKDVELVLSTIETSLTIEQITVKSLLPYLKLNDKQGNKREKFSFWEVLQAIAKLAVNN